LTTEDYEAALWLFLTDVANKEYAIIPLSDHIVASAVELTRRHPLRGYDAVHLATATTVRTALHGKELPPLVFVSADQALCEAAEAEGLPPVNPSKH
jgi:predicted nucleic acid-binding protein